MREPFKAPEWAQHLTTAHNYLRLAQAFEQWANQPAHLTATPQVEQAAAGDDVRELAANAWQELVEYDDRTSPEEHPDMALITRDELAEFIARACCDYIAKQVVPDGEVVNAVCKPLSWGNKAVRDLLADMREHGFLIIRAPQL